MTEVLRHNSYGKQHIRLTKVMRHAERHELMELSADIQLEGDFAAAYTEGDNTKIIATDSLKNTVYVLAKENKFENIETFATLLARHFKKTYRQVRIATIDIAQILWQRIDPHAFVGGSTERRTCSAKLGEQLDQLDLSGGIAGLQVLKTADSAFANFVKDRYRTLPDTSDRIFATSVEADWKYSGEADYDKAYAAIRTSLLQTFAGHHSLSVQQTLMQMGQAALDACSSIRSISLTMPNQHRIGFNLEPFGLKNENDIFVPVDEPYGLITGVVERK
ncbi:MAG TPA: urate oxidase [Phycisphaerae bacterium]|nr:urate oxidase [Phycisphaerae bacterium]